MIDVKTGAAIVGTLFGGASVVWGVGLTVGRSEVAVARGELEAHRDGSAEVHRAQDERITAIKEELRHVTDAAKAASEDARATRNIVERRFGVRPSGGDQ